MGSHVTDCSVHTGDSGVKIGVDITDCGAGDPIDLSSGATVAIFLTRPSGSVTSHVAVFADFGGAAGDGTDGRFMYVTLPADLDEEGQWCVQPRITDSSGVYSGTISYFRVDAGATL